MKRLLIFCVRVYQTCFSARKITPCCRFYPSCSAYAIEALEEYGALEGSRLAIRRLLRCHPFGGSGYDPVPLPERFHNGGSAS